MKAPNIFVLAETGLAARIETILRDFESAYKLLNAQQAQEQQVQCLIEEGIPPCLLLLDADWQMGDSLALVRNLRQKAFWQHQTVLLITERVDEAFLQAASDAGISDFLAKPVSRSELLLGLRRVQAQPRGENSVLDRQVLGPSEQKYALLYDSAPDMMVSVDPETTLVIACNQAVADALGYSKAEILGQPVFNLYHSDCLPKMQAIFQTFVTTGRVKNAEMLLKRKDGSKIEVSLNALAVRNEAGQILFSSSTWRDISQQKKLQRQMQTEQERFLKIFEYSAVGKAVLDHQGNLRRINPSLAAYFGYTQAELLQMTFIDLTHPEDIAKDWEQFQALLRNEIQAYSMEKRYFHKDGHILYGLLNVAAVHDEDGKPEEIIGQVVDISERVALEQSLRKERQALEQSFERLEERNQELQDFAYIASHDLQEPLRKVRAFSDRLTKYAAGQLDERALDYLQRMHNAAGRMQQMIQDLLQYSRIWTRARPFEKVDLNVVLDNVLNTLDLSLEETQTEIQRDHLPCLEADGAQLELLLQNLMGNALKYHSPERLPRIQVFAEIQEQEMVLHVQDNGIGFDEKYLDRIFKPFQRLFGNDEYPGNGIGLAICKKIVERHQGDIWAHGQPGQGACFSVRLPLKRNGSMGEEPQTDTKKRGEKHV